MFLLSILNDSFIKYISIAMFRIDTDYSTISVYNNNLVFSFVVIVDKKEQKRRGCIVNFYAFSYQRLFFLINMYQGLFGSISFGHALYMGKEIYKAELSKIFKQKYIQS